MTETAADVADRLRTFLAAEGAGPDPRIVGLARAGLGRSRQNWLFDLEGAGEPEPLILRSDPEGGLVETDRHAEFALLRALEAADLPTPRARWLDADGSRLGSPALIMRRIDGVCDYRVLSGDRPEAVRRALAAHELARWEAILRRDQLQAHPELDLALEHLRARAPRAERTVLVHSDFKPGNILLVGDEVSALLDWELAHLGDPLEDLGWVTQPLRAGEHAIPGVWEPADLLAHYEHVTGHAVDRDALAWWVTFSTFKTAVMQVSGLRSFLEGRSDEPYRPHPRVLGSLLDAVTAEGA